MDVAPPVVLLDLDGVLNPFAAPVCPDGYQEHVFFDGEEPGRYRVADGEWIREVAAVGVPFRPELKAPAIDAMVGDRPTAWIDDNHTDAGRRWTSERTAPTLLLPLDPALSWTREDVDRVLVWATARNQTTPRWSTFHRQGTVNLRPALTPLSRLRWPAGVPWIQE